eukprot:jgi/Chrzof1/4817/Cz15g00140.t1
MPAEQMAPADTLRFQGRIESMDRPPSLEELKHLLQQAICAVQAYALAHPEVQNTLKLSRRIRKDLDFVERHQQLGADLADSCLVRSRQHSTAAHLR